MDIQSQLFVLGINHQKAPVAIRERLSFPNSKLREALCYLINLDGIEGGVILSTCNRSEIYISTHSSPLTPLERKTHLLGWCEEGNNFGCSLEARTNLLKGFIIEPLKQFFTYFQKIDYIGKSEYG